MRTPALGRGGPGVLERWRMNCKLSPVLAGATQAADAAAGLGRREALDGSGLGGWVQAADAPQ